LVDRNPRLAEGVLNERGQDFDVSASGNLGHYPAIGLMLLRLPDDSLSEDSSITCDKRDRTVVAGRFKAEDKTHFACGPLPDHR
jgi:hypothetical protein